LMMASVGYEVDLLLPIPSDEKFGTKSKHVLESVHQGFLRIYFEHVWDPTSEPLSYLVQSRPSRWEYGNEGNGVSER
jgi:hypothetical protein